MNLSQVLENLFFWIFLSTHSHVPLFPHACGISSALTTPQPSPHVMCLPCLISSFLTLQAHRTVIEKIDLLQFFGTKLTRCFLSAFKFIFNELQWK